MSRKEKRLDAIRNNPVGASFDDLCACLESQGFVLQGGAGSHMVYRHPGPPAQTLSVQSGSAGKAKAYQVKQFLEMVDELYPEEEP